MKKIILTLLLFIIPSYSYADIEEEKCIELLNESINNDNRFNNNSTNDVLVNGNLTEVLYDESNSSYADLSTYSGFLDNIVINPNPHNFGGLTEKDFIAKRNNIGTIIANDNYVITNIVGFGKDSKFDFPLDNSNGDKYELKGDWFREYVLYTHHNFEGDLMSCGIIKIKPLNNRSFTDISKGNYKTNILKGENCNSSFEGNEEYKDGLDFYKLKSNVCVVDYEDKDYLKMEVISIAYNNGSSYMNEYITHQLQVRAMTDLGTNHEGGLKGIYDKFMEYLNEKTCLKIIHPTEDSLPSNCNGSYSPSLLSYKVDNIESKSLLSHIFPSAYAKREGLSLEKEVENSRGIMVYGKIPYNIYNKINSIKDNTFKSYILLSIMPNFEDSIKKRQESNIVITPYEKTFLSCGLGYKKRSEIVIDFIKKLKDTELIEYKKLEYLDPKFGDCIIPYPDKRNIDKEVVNSFETNKLLAKKLNGTYISPEVSEKIQLNIQERKKVELEYNNKINQASIDFNGGKITKLELDKKIKNLKKEFDTKIKKVEEKELNIKEKINKEENTNISNDRIDNNNYKMISFIVLLFIIGSGILYITLRKKEK